MTPGRRPGCTGESRPDLVQRATPKAASTVTATTVGGLRQDRRRGGVRALLGGRGWSTCSPIRTCGRGRGRLDGAVAGDGAGGGPAGCAGRGGGGARGLRRRRACRWCRRAATPGWSAAGCRPGSTGRWCCPPGGCPGWRRWPRTAPWSPAPARRSPRCRRTLPRPAGSSGWTGPPGTRPPSAARSPRTPAGCGCCAGDRPGPSWSAPSSRWPAASCCPGWTVRSRTPPATTCPGCCAAARARSGC